MYTVSPGKILHITIYNQHPGLELTSPVYDSNGITHHVSHNQQAGTDNTVEASFGIDFKKGNFRGSLLYKLQRKNAIRTDNRPNSSITFIEDTIPNVYLFVTWFVSSNYRGFHVFLVEFTTDFTWDDDKLWRMFWKYNRPSYLYHLTDLIIWSMSDGTFIRTKRNVRQELAYELDLIISEVTWQYSTMSPLRIDPKRLVLSSSMLIVLIHAISLTIPHSFELTIHNWCSNVDFVSPIYIINDQSDFQAPPDHIVRSGDTMRTSLISILNIMSYGALIYKLQKRKSHKSIKISEDTSSAVHLLVIWCVSWFELYANVLLVGHDERFDWDKDDLRELYNRNIDQFKRFICSATETWSLDNNTTLMTVFEMMNGQLLNITISEVEEYDYVRTPVHADIRR
jgi:hypothetical protein